MNIKKVVKWFLPQLAGGVALLLLAGTLGLGTNADAAASVGIVVIEIPFENVPVPNTCTGEMISETGNIVARLIVVASAGGGFNLHLHFQFKATGIGEFGNEYIVNQEGREKLIRVPPVGGVFTHTDNYVQISKGSAENTKLYFTYTLIIQPDGSFELRSLKFRLGCHG